MSRGNEIIVRSDPCGRFDEGICSGALQPGILVEVKAATALSLGVPTFQPVSRSTGAKGPVAVLLPDYLRGRLGVGAARSYGPGAPGDAYADGDRCFVYWPEAGDELNLLVADVAGTADDVAIGDLFGVVTATGKLHANSAYGSAPFMAMEVITDPSSEYMLHVQYLGNQA